MTLLIYSTLNVARSTHFFYSFSEHSCRPSHSSRPLSLALLLPKCSSVARHSQRTLQKIPLGQQPLLLKQNRAGYFQTSEADFVPCTRERQVLGQTSETALPVPGARCSILGKKICASKWPIKLPAPAERTAETGGGRAFVRCKNRHKYCGSNGPSRLGVFPFFPRHLRRHDHGEDTTHIMIPRAAWQEHTAFPVEVMFMNRSIKG